MKPLVSIISPTYNDEKTIKNTIKSVINQSYKNWEMIIVDDCSKDNTGEIIKKFQEQDKRIKYIKLNENSGASVARNKAIKEAKGKYIAFLDCDDLWFNKKLEKQVKFMEDNDYAFTYTDYEYMDQNGKILNKKRVCPKKVSYFRMLLGDSIGCLTVMYNKEKIGLIQIPVLRKRNDYALWCKVLKKVKKGYKYDAVLSRYRVSEKSISSGKKSKLLKYHYQMHRECNGFNSLVAIFFTCTNIIVYITNKFFRDKESK